MPVFVINSWHTGEIHVLIAEFAMNFPIHLAEVDAPTGPISHLVVVIEVDEASMCLSDSSIALISLGFATLSNDYPLCDRGFSTRQVQIPLGDLTWASRETVDGNGVLATDGDAIMALHEVCCVHQRERGFASLIRETDGSRLGSLSSSFEGDRSS